MHAFLLAATMALPGTVAELADENLGGIVKQLLAGQKANDLQVERNDVFAGLEAIRQTGQERHVGQFVGWNFKIREKPKAKDEYRYIRFAWRKDGGGSILVAFALDGGKWSGTRYVAGPYALGASGHKVAEAAPSEWTVVTRDFFKDFGEHTISSALFSSTGTGTAYFDHLLLGKTVADLDRATAVALGKNATVPLRGAALDTAWADLIGDDRAKSLVAFRGFLATAPDHVEYIRAHLPKEKAVNQSVERMKELVQKLGVEDFAEREAATQGLLEIGAPAITHLQAVLDDVTSPERQFRAAGILKKMGVKPGETTPALARAARIARLLERAGTPEAKELLQKMADGGHGSDYAAESLLALSRMKSAK